jgi:multicomponent Na+:H+ antiporter subunit G
MILEVLAAAAVMVGTLFLFTASVGLVKMPDVLCRGHALGLASTLGILVLLFGLFLSVPGASAAVKIGLAILLQFLTIPIASHLIALLSHRKGVVLAVTRRVHPRR